MCKPFTRLSKADHPVDLTTVPGACGGRWDRGIALPACAGGRTPLAPPFSVCEVRKAVTHRRNVCACCRRTRTLGACRVPHTQLLARHNVLSAPLVVSPGLEDMESMSMEAAETSPSLVRHGRDVGTLAPVSPQGGAAVEMVCVLLTVACCCAQPRWAGWT